MKKTILLCATVHFAAFLIAGATTANVTAQRGTGVFNFAGNPLTGTQVDLGYLDDDMFNLLEPIAITGDPLPGMFGGSISFDSNPYVDFQPAIRIFSDDDNFAIAYSTSWTFSPGDGGGLDTNSDNFDLVDVVFNGALTDTGVIRAPQGSRFALNGPVHQTFETESLAIGAAEIIPEPSIYALSIGIMALGFVVRHRNNRRT